MKRAFIVEVGFAVIFILFWLAVVYLKVTDFSEFKREMANQVFPGNVAVALPYVLSAVWFGICVLLVDAKTRLIGMVFNFLLILSFTIYVGLAVFNVYTRTPCSCAGLFDLQWKGQLYFNLIVTAVAGAGVISTLTFKNKERRKQGMDTIVSHAPLTACE